MKRELGIRLEFPASEVKVHAHESLTPGQVAIGYVFKCEPGQEHGFIDGYKTAEAIMGPSNAVMAVVSHDAMMKWQLKLSLESDRLNQEVERELKKADS